MKILGAVLTILYGGLMLFAVCKKKEKNMPAAFIAGGSFMLFVYTLLSFVRNGNFILLLIISMLAISAGTLLNGIRQKNVHIHHHLIRLMVEAVLTAICWFGG